eukprot:Colp12_sorted_trinity150504_noHs@10913
MSNVKKRSRFAKNNEKIAAIGAESDAFADDYMAPVDQLLNSSGGHPAIKDPVEASSKKTKISLQTLMDEGREKSMSVPISSSNIGFKMLKNFGYNEGEGLGKEGQGLLEPIAVQKRNNKDVSGLGVLEKRDRVQKTLQSIKNHKLATRDELLTTFVSNKANQQRAARAIADMKKAQKVIYELDEQAEIPVHELTASLHVRYEAIRASKTVEEVAKESNSTNNLVGYDKYAGTDMIDTVLEDDLPARDSCTETTFVAETPT